MESEKAKAKAGKLYDANNDIELVSEREACKEVCYELNSLRPSQKKERESIIRPATLSVNIDNPDFSRKRVECE